MTALPLEFAAMRSHLKQVQSVHHPAGTIYEAGWLTIGTGKRIRVALAESGPGNVPTAAETERAISFFKPHCALFVGVAGGVKDVNLGDVVCSTDVIGYESGKDESERFLTRGSMGKPASALVQVGKSVARNKGWEQWFPEHDPRRQKPPHAFVGSIGAGEKVVASNRSATFEFLKAHYSQILAVEMEGRGFLEATYVNHDVRAIVIRGISDLIEGKSEADASGSQEAAAAAASAFACQLLQVYFASRVFSRRSVVTFAIALLLIGLCINLLRAVWPADDPPKYDRTFLQFTQELIAAKAQGKVRDFIDRHKGRPFDNWTGIIKHINDRNNRPYYVVVPTPAISGDVPQIMAVFTAGFDATILEETEITFSGQIGDGVEAPLVITLEECKSAESKMPDD
ncbi:MAG: hypothetical protein AB7O68_08175 [Pirellulales bacterium]